MPLSVRLVLLALLLVPAACQRQEGGAPGLLIPAEINSQTSVAAGEDLFHRLCRECHGTLAEGRNQRAERFVPPAPDFHSPEYTDMDATYLFVRIRDGKMVEPYYSLGSVMPAWGPYLRTEEIWQLVGYLKQRPGGE